MYTCILRTGVHACVYRYACMYPSVFADENVYEMLNVDVSARFELSVDVCMCICIHIYMYIHMHRDTIIHSTHT
jgi:hypothetical protein